MIVDAEFTSVWDGGFAITTNCKVNLETREVFDIERDETYADAVDVLDKEYITINGENFPVSCRDEGELKGSFWYEG